MRNDLFTARGLTLEGWWDGWDSWDAGLALRSLSAQWVVPAHPPTSIVHNPGDKLGLLRPQLNAFVVGVPVPWS